VRFYFTGTELILFYWYWILIWLQCKPQQGSCS